MKLAIVALALCACVPPQQQPYSPVYAPPPPAPGSEYAGNPAPQQAVEHDGDDEAPPPVTPAQRAKQRPRKITINGAYLTQSRAQTLAQLEIGYHGSLPDGAYWYDPVNGACGVWGQPAAAILPAGLDLGPPLPSNASNGTSGVYINNRQLQHAEVQFLSALVGVQWQRGRYFVDAMGNAGLEGGGVLVNLVQVAQQRGQAASGGGGAGGDYSKTYGFGEGKSSFFSSADGSCKSFTSQHGTVFVGC
jgi:hypothetical protein